MEFLIVLRGIFLNNTDPKQKGLFKKNLFKKKKKLI